MTYVPALDGLRAVAILAVLLFHLFPQTVPGGFTGVDVFFVLSGYLITSVILGDLRAREFSLGEFYLRRIQRLLPNCALMILVTVGVARHLLLPSAAAGVAEHGLWGLANLSNVYIQRHAGGYWGDSAASMPLLHTWSLAVEEQFYLLFPLLVLLVARSWESRLLRVVGCLTLFGFAFNVVDTWWNFTTNDTGVFYLLRTRAWEPLLGAAFATYRMPCAAEKPLRPVPASRAGEVLGWLGLIGIVVGCFGITHGKEMFDRFPGVVALLPTSCALAVIRAITDGGNGVARFLSHPLAVGIGKRSYSLYLWHWPFIVFGKVYAELAGRSPRTYELIGAAVGIVCGCLAYEFVEQPLRVRGAGRARRLVLIGSGFAFTLSVSLGAFMSPPPIAGAFKPSITYFMSYNAIDSDYEKALRAAEYAGVTFVPPAEPVRSSVWKEGGIVHLWGDGTPHVVVLGSSHGSMFGRVLDDLCKQRKISIAFLCGDRQRVDFGMNDEAPGFDMARRHWLAEWRPELVIAIDRWDLYPPEDFSRRMTEFVAELDPHAQRILFFSQVPALSIGDKINLREYASKGIDVLGRLPGIPPDAKEHVRRAAHAVLSDLADGNPKVRLLRIDEPFYLPDGTVRYAAEQDFFYIDDNHLTQVGTELACDRCAVPLAEIFGSLTNGPSDDPATSAAIAESDYDRLRDRLRRAPTARGAAGSGRLRRNGSSVDRTRVNRGISPALIRDVL